MEISERADLLKWMQANAEPAFARFSSALIPGLQRPMLGIRIPKLRSMARSLAKMDSHRALHDLLTTETFEEVLLRGFVIGYAKAEWKDTWTEICNFVALIDNWEICDCCCSSFTAVRKHRDEVFPVLLRYLQSDKEYEQRFAVVMMMDHFLTDEYVEAVLNAWRRVRPRGYYVEMAIGWALSVSFLSYREATLPLLLDEQMPVACRKKACQKILESKRTPAEWRSEIKSIKSKY